MKFLLLITTMLLGSLASLASAEIVDNTVDNPGDTASPASAEIAGTTVDPTDDTSEISDAAIAGQAQQQPHSSSVSSSANRHMPRPPSHPLPPHGGKGTKKCDALPVCLADQAEARDKFIDVGGKLKKGKWRACNTNANVILYKGKEQEPEYVDKSDGYYNFPHNFRLKNTKAAYLADSGNTDYVKFSASNQLTPNSKSTKQKLGMKTEFSILFPGYPITGEGHSLVDAFDSNTIHVTFPVSATGSEKKPNPRGDSPYMISVTCKYFADVTKFSSGYDSERMECTGSADRVWFGEEKVGYGTKPALPFSFIFSSTLVPLGKDCPCDPAELKCSRTGH